MVKEDLTEFLQPTEFFDFNKKRVRELAQEITKGFNSNNEKAIALFYWVRDQIKYNMFTYYPKVKANLKASVTIRRGNGFCMSKAVLLSTLARAVDIPAKIHMVDIVNHKISKKVIDLMGTNAFHCHGYSELLLNGKWVKLTPVFDKETSIKAGFLPMIEFDGVHDAMFASCEANGNKYVEYVEDRGSYTDVPLKEIDKIFTEKYPKWYANIASIEMKPRNRKA
ncbi:MAG: transglutaminase-like domain-containing protein [Promethearchaeota archaeon]